MSLSTPARSPTTDIFPLHRKNQTPRHVSGVLKVHFDRLPWNTVDVRLPAQASNDSARIFDVGTYLSHHCLADSHLEPVDLLDRDREQTGVDQMVPHPEMAALSWDRGGLDIVVDGYLGIGAWGTVFAVSLWTREWTRPSPLV